MNYRSLLVLFAVIAAFVAPLMWQCLVTFGTVAAALRAR